MKDGSANREKTLALYWRARRQSGQKTPDAINTELLDLYQQLDAAHILRARLTPAGWQTWQPRERVILTQDQLTDQLLVIVSNQTRNRRTFTISSQDSNGGVQVLPESIELNAGATTGLFLRMLGKQSGNLSSSIRVVSEGQATEVAVPCQVRNSGRLMARILDPQGKATAARVFLSGSDGVRRSPEGSIDRVMWMSGEHFFYANGVAQAELPEGKAILEVVKGFDFFPVVREVEIKPKKTTRVEVRLSRLENMNAKGWYSGDEHIHGNYRGDQSITPEDNLLMVQAEDLNVANLMVANSDGAQIHDEQHFEGKPHSLSTRDHLLYWNQEMRNGSRYGHLILLNLRELIQPIYTGFPGTPNWEDYPSNYQQASKARAQGGYAAYAHPAIISGRIPEGHEAQESVVDVALGAIDAMEVFCGRDEPSMELWYRFLNCGFRLGIAAGSDAMINHKFIFVAGGVRSYVYTGGTFSYPEWIRGLAAGRAFATAGPLLFFEIENQLPGHNFHFPKGPVTLKARARVASAVPITQLEIISSGQVMDTVSSDTPTQELQWEGQLKLDRSSWLAARVRGPEHRLIPNSPHRHYFSEPTSQRILLAHTGASYVYLGKQPIFSDSDRAFMLRWIDQLIHQVRREGQFATDERRTEVINIFQRARKVYDDMRN